MEQCRDCVRYSERKELLQCRRSYRKTAFKRFCYFLRWKRKVRIEYECPHKMKDPHWFSTYPINCRCSFHISDPETISNYFQRRSRLF